MTDLAVKKPIDVAQKKFMKALAEKKERTKLQREEKDRKNVKLGEILFLQRINDDGGKLKMDQDDAELLDIYANAVQSRDRKAIDIAIA